MSFSPVAPTPQDHVGVINIPCSLSAFEKLSDDVLSNIFSRLSLSELGIVSLVSRRTIGLVTPQMKDLAFQAQNQQVADKLGKKFGCPFSVVNVDLLQRLGVNVFEIAKKSARAALGEFDMMLEWRFGCAESYPFDIFQVSLFRGVVARRFLANTIRVAQFFFGMTIFNQAMCNSKQGAEELVDVCMSEVKRKISSIPEQSVENQILKNQVTVSACLEQVQKIIDYLRDKQPLKEHERLLNVLPGSVGNSPDCISCMNLQIPPIQLLSQIRPPVDRLRLSLASTLPIGIWSLTQIKELSLEGCDFKALPSTILKMQLRKLGLYDCEELELLPQGFGNMASLQCLEILGRSRLTSGDQEIVKLIERNIQVIIASHCSSSE